MPHLPWFVRVSSQLAPVRRHYASMALLVQLPDKNYTLIVKTKGNSLFASLSTRSSLTESGWSSPTGARSAPAERRRRTLRRTRCAGEHRVERREPHVCEVSSDRKVEHQCRNLKQWNWTLHSTTHSNSLITAESVCNWNEPRALASRNRCFFRSSSSRARRIFSRCSFKVLQEKTV